LNPKCLQREPRSWCRDNPENRPVEFQVLTRRKGKHALGLKAVVVDAHEVRIKAHRPKQKSDRRDAFELCEGLRRDIYRVRVHVPPGEVLALRETISRRRHFVRVQTAEINAAKRLLRAEGLGHLSRYLGKEAGWTKLLASLADREVLRGYVGQHHAVWRCAGEQVRALEEALVEQQLPFASALARLQTIPGVGPIVATTAVAVISDAHRFPSAKHAASYTGLTPATYRSAARVVHGRITRHGSAELRGMLCEAAHHANRPAHPLNPYFRKLCSRRGYKMAIVAVAHRLARIIFAMLRDEADFDVSKLGIEVGPFSHTTVRRYRLKAVSARG
jgi:transposase